MARHFVVSGLLLITLLPQGYGTSQQSSFSREVLAKALEAGNSMATIEIRSMRVTGTMVAVRINVVELIVPGDLGAGDVNTTFEQTVSSIYAVGLQAGSQYAAFIARGQPYLFQWSFLNDIAKIHPTDQDAIRRLREAAESVYEKSAIRQFRQAPMKAPSELPVLPDELAAACKEFRDRPAARGEAAKKISESDLASQMDRSRPYSSTISFLPPKIHLSRSQVLSLLGPPTWHFGWFYSWRCDDIASVQDGGPNVGVLVVRFDHNGMTDFVHYDMYERANWIRSMSDHSQAAATFPYRSSIHLLTATCGVDPLC
jgi:hypothetical protein